ncbi:MAG: hypothetical protein J6N21_06250, partial [Butyrivibrio sp.]|nr:hypothetical protein [Butyrivibrio sp.]
MAEKVKKCSTYTLICFFITLMIWLFVFIVNNRNSGIVYNDNKILGAGTVLNPYKISSESDLRTLGKMVLHGENFSEKYIVQTCDINMSDDTSFEPIAPDGTVFLGNYNGCGHQINNLHIIQDKEAALFINMGGVLENLIIGDGIIRANNVASFAINSNNESSATIRNCYNFADLYGTDRASGIADDFSGGSIEFCYNYGTITSNSSFRICGTNAEEVLTVEILKLDMPKSFDGYIYAVKGNNDHNIRVINSFLKQKSASNNYIFVSELNGLILPNPNYVIEEDICGINGSGSKGKPYKVQDLDDFLVFRDLVNSGIDFYNKYFEQTDDIDLASQDNFEPIGVFDSGNAFAGYYDGAGYSISNLRMDRNDNCGLFGVLAGTVMNLSVKNGYIRGSCVGTITSHSLAGTCPQIVNCLVKNIDIEGSVRTGYIADNFTGGYIMLCAVEVSDEKTQGFICSYDAGGIINSYIIASERKLLPYDQQLFSGKNIDEKKKTLDIASFFNDYINKHVVIRNIANSKLCRWNEGTIDLTKDKGSTNIIVLTFTIMAIIVLLVVFLISKYVNLNHDITNYFVNMPGHRKMYVFAIYICAIIFVAMNVCFNGIGISNLLYRAVRDSFSDRWAMILLASEYGGERYVLSPSFYPPFNTF